MKFFVPADISFVKSEDRNTEMRIRGYASTPDIDQEGERILQEGLDITDFVKRGFFNLDHDNSVILGYPDEDKTYLSKDGLFVEGVLLNTTKAKDIWETAVALQKSGAPRQMGFSVEGTVLGRDKDGKITQAKVTNVAITPTPVNPHATWEVIAKSLTTNNAAAIIPESLEGIKAFTNKLDNNDKEALDVFNKLKDNLNKSTDEYDIRAYLMLFHNLEGKALDEKVEQVIGEINKE